MAQTANIDTLARQFAHGVLNDANLRRAVTAARLRAIPPPLWQPIENESHRAPRYAHARARVALEIARHKHDHALRARAEFALIQTLNTLGEHARARAWCETTAARFKKVGDCESAAQVWIQAAWAQTFLGGLDAARAALQRAQKLSHSPAIQFHCTWIEARVLHQQGEYAQAVAQFSKLRAQLDPREVLDAARLLCELAVATERLNPADALPMLEQARARFIENDCATDLALCDYYFAQTLMDLNRFDEAEECLRRVKIFTHAEQLRFLGACCDLDLGYLRWHQNQFQAALALQQHARAVFVELDAVQEVSSCEINIAVDLREVNQYAEAIPYLENALAIALDTGRHSKAAVCHTNLGEVYELMGNYARALQHYNAARELLASKNIRMRVLECDIALGKTHLHLGQWRDARRAWQRARQLARRAKIPSAVAQADLYLAQLAFTRGQRAHARLARARKQFQQLGQTNYVAYCERLLAQTYASQRTRGFQRARGLRHLQTSRKLFARNHQFVDVALCDLVRGELHLQWGEWSDARRAFRRARNILEPAFPDHAWRIAYGLGHIARAGGNEAGALREWMRGSEMIARLRGGIGLEAWSNDLFDARAKIFRDTLKFAHKQNRADETLRVIEFAKAQLFLQQLAVRHERAPRALHTALKERARALQQSLIQQRKQLLFDAAQSSNPTRASLSQMLAALNETLRAYETAAERLRLARQGLTGSPALAPFALDAFRVYANARWGDAWTALDYFFANGNLYIAQIDTHRVEVHATRWMALDQARLTHACSANESLREWVYRGTLHGFAAPTRSDALEYLTARLIPARVRAHSAERVLIISPHALLHQLPFHALEQNGAPLLERFTFMYAPSLQALVELARNPHASPPRALVCGAETFADAPPLQHTRAEVNQWKRGRKVTTLWQHRATRAALLQQNERGALAQYDILHFATHAIAEPNAPHWSRILLGDGELSVLDITDLNLDARLVTLSACSTALGKGGGKGDEWLGLPRAFFYAGARAVVASLWNVDDASTTELMKLFYQNLDQGKSIARALRDAQRVLQQKGLDAYHWAAFVAMGDV